MANHCRRNRQFSFYVASCGGSTWWWPRRGQRTCTDCSTVVVLVTGKAQGGRISSLCRVLWQSKVAAKTGGAKFQWEIMRSMGLSDEQIKDFASPAHWLTYFPPIAMVGALPIMCNRPPSLGLPYSPPIAMAGLVWPYQTTVRVRTGLASPNQYVNGNLGWHDAGPPGGREVVSAGLDEAVPVRIPGLFLRLSFHLLLQENLRSPAVSI